MTNDIKSLKRILSTEAGRPLREFLLEHYRALNSLEGVREIDNADDLAIELKATKKALKTVRAILSEIISIEQFNSNSTEEDDKLFQL